MSAYDLFSLDGITLWMMIKFSFWWMLAGAIATIPFVVIKRILEDC